MRKLLTFLIALGAIVFAVVSPGNAGSMTLMGVGSAPHVATYQGPGDIFTFNRGWYSCAFVYNAASASMATNLCDLVDSAAPSTVICTLRGSASGAVDLTNAYCTGSVTPATKCAAATGGVCQVSQVYDQSGSGMPLLNSTAASQPKLTFNAVGTSPCMLFSGAQQINASVSWASTPQPYSASLVAERTSGTATGSFLGNGNSGVIGTTGGQWALYPTGTGLNFNITDGSFHAVQGLYNGATSLAYVDGTSTSGTMSNVTWSSTNILGARAGQFITGYACEGGWASGDQSSHDSAMNSNQHSRYGF